jgi:hypothetical protein
MPGEQVIIQEPTTTDVAQSFLAHGDLVVTTSDVVGTLLPADPNDPPFSGTTEAPPSGYDWSVQFRRAPVGNGQTLRVETVDPPIVWDTLPVNVVNGGHGFAPSAMSTMTTAEAAEVNGAPQLVIDCPAAAGAGAVPSVPPRFRARGRVNNRNRRVYGLVIKPGTPPSAVVGRTFVCGKDWRIEFEDVPVGNGQILRVRSRDGCCFADVRINVVVGVADPCS